MALEIRVKAAFGAAELPGDCSEKTDLGLKKSPPSEKTPSLYTLRFGKSTSELAWTINPLCCRVSECLQIYLIYKRNRSTKYKSIAKGSTSV
ncbi:hypothetical protein MKW98_009321 [Papaver atlanticum]|uniref:Uncharacterized protein n=1 Tax=Papaver atlanticum TaxID=357466 RepID=A0AAD4RZ69_9MAGN|nr:hypothetical protein MKW98_009321 [Papaver atlanticum]